MIREKGRRRWIIGTEEEQILVDPLSISGAGLPLLMSTCGRTGQGSSPPAPPSGHTPTRNSETCEPYKKRI